MRYRNHSRLALWKFLATDNSKICFFRVTDFFFTIKPIFNSVSKCRKKSAIVNITSYLGVSRNWTETMENWPNLLHNKVVMILSPNYVTPFYDHIAMGNWPFIKISFRLRNCLFEVYINFSCILDKVKGILHLWIKISKKGFYQKSELNDNGLGDVVDINRFTTDFIVIRPTLHWVCRRSPADIITYSQWSVYQIHANNYFLIYIV